MKRNKTNSPSRHNHLHNRSSKVIKGSSTVWVDPAVILTKAARRQKNQPKKKDTIKSCWYFG